MKTKTIDKDSMAYQEGGLAFATDAVKMPNKMCMLMSYDEARYMPFCRPVKCPVVSETETSVTYDVTGPE